MILRLLIGTGVILMLLGFGAAGWQYWQTPDAVSPVPASASLPLEASARQAWLIAPDGGLVLQEQVQAYLAQDRFVPGRVIEVIREARLADLLVDEETLPEAAYLQVLADIRAPRTADGLCEVVLRSFAEDCAVAAARVVENSVDPVGGTALFRLTLAFRLPKDAAEMPDLAASVLRTETNVVELEAGTPGTDSAEAALSTALSGLTEACAGDVNRPFCRPMRFSLTWKQGAPVSLQSEVSWLDTLPDGMYAAPPLGPEG